MSVSRPRVFLDVSIDGVPAGRLVIELFADKTPKTCENFRQLCTGEFKGITYARCPFHRVIDEFMVQGGDIERGDGTGTVSIYDGKEFEDEDLTWREIDAAGLVCAANRGKNTNGSQFFITLEATPHLNGKHTIFGRLVTGEDVLRKIADVSVDKDDRPNVPVLISRCGELERKRKREDDRALRATPVGNDRGRARRTDGDDTLMSGTKSPPGHERRRLSDNIIDEGLRGRPRKRSKQRPDSQLDEEMESSQQHSPVKIHKRKRSSSPSREAEDRGEPNPHRRRRRSLPNQYDGIDGRSTDRRARQPVRDRDRDDWTRDKFRDEGPSSDRRHRPERARQQGQQGRRRHQADRWHPNEGRLSNDDRGSSDSGVKFKGRGVMKYREPGRLS